MRKQLLVLITGAALSLFTVAATAQNGSDMGVAKGSQSNPDASTSSNPADPGIQSDNGRTNNDNLAVKRGLEGCVVKVNSDYFLKAATGERRRLAGEQDFSSYVDKQVKVEGKDLAEGHKVTNGTGEPASTDRSATSGSASSETQNNAAGSIAGNAGSPNASGTAASTDYTAPDFMVSKIKIVSDSCQPKVKSTQP